MVETEQQYTVLLTVLFGFFEFVRAWTVNSSNNIFSRFLAFVHLLHVVTERAHVFSP